MRRKIAIFSTAAATLILLASASTTIKADGHGNRNHGIIPIHERPHGKTYAEWNAVFWKWTLSLPVDYNPLYDTAPYDAGQEGHEVIFLGGTFTANATGEHSVLGTAKRSCTIPPGTSLFFPILNSEASTLENNGTTYDALAASAKDAVDHVVKLEATIDGVPVEDLFDYRVGVSRLFKYGPLPDNNVLENLYADTDLAGNFPEGAVSPAVADGYCLMLEPLHPGKHTIHFGGVQQYTVEKDGFDFTFTLDITYHITVAGCEH
jgi:hypothetical protein